MAPWYEEAEFYHIYPIGLTGAPRKNESEETVHRFSTLEQWLPHIADLGCTAIYIGPLFESTTHGYDTKDYKQVDRRLGDNADFAAYVKKAHELGIKVVVDGVFNHTGREFFAFRDIQEKREQSPYCGWYKGIWFGGNTCYNDGFSYEAWRNCFELVNLNLQNQQVRDYLLDVIDFWIDEFDIDGIRLDCADCLDFGFMEQMRARTSAKKQDFWLMGEVIHGDYARYIGDGQHLLHSVTNYELHKGLYSGHNDHNYFEIAHTIRREFDENGGIYKGKKLYSFVDNHDVDRLASKLNVKENMIPIYALLYFLPGIPSIYYGSEFGIEGRKEGGNDDPLRPALNLEELEKNPPAEKLPAWIKTLSDVRKKHPAARTGRYRELMLTNRQYAFARNLDGVSVIVTVNNDDNAASMDLAAGNAAEYVGTLTGEKVSVENGRIHVTVAGNSGNIWVPAGDMPEYKPVEMNAKTPKTTNTTVKADNADQTKEEAAATVAEQNTTPISQALKNAANTDSIKETVATTVGNSDCTANASEKAADGTTSNTTTASEPASEKSQITVDWSKSPEDMTVEELQAGILAKMANNGPVTDQMKKTVYDNIWHDSLVNWLKSFR